MQDSNSKTFGGYSMKRGLSMLVVSGRLCLVSCATGYQAKGLIGVMLTRQVQSLRAVVGGGAR